MTWWRDDVERRKRLAEHGGSARALGRATGVHHATISDWEARSRHSEVVLHHDSGVQNIGSPPSVIPLRKRRMTRQFGDYERVVFLSDIHAPFHDEIVWDQVLRFVQDYDPDRIVVNGDLVDAYNVSRFSKDPNRRHNLQDEIDISRGLLASLRDRAQNARIDLTTGNHESRVERYLWSQAPELSSLRCLRLGELLSLNELEIELHGVEGFLLRPKFRVKHGDAVRKHSGHSAKSEFEKHGISGISGHTHRMGTYEVRNDAGVFAWTEQGCLCDMNPEYINGIANWAAGFAVGEFATGGNRYQLELVRVPEQRLVYRGRDYSQM